MAIEMETATWVIAGASVVNVVVLVAYAWFTWGIWRETRRAGQRTEALARQARDAFRLQILVGYQEEIRWAKDYAAKRGQDLGAPSKGVALMEQALQAAFPEEWPEIQRVLATAAEEWMKQTGRKG